jgi:two-component system sensor histidine kinase YesM
MVLMLISMIFPLLLLILFAMNISKNTFEREVVNSNRSRIILAGKYVDEKVEQSDKILYSNLIDIKLIPSISHARDVNISLQYNALDYIQDKLFSIYYGNEYVESVSLYAKESHTVYSIKDDNYLVNEISNDSNSKWDHLARTSHYVFESNKGEQSFSLTRSIVRFEDRKIVGGISLEINWKIIDRVLDMLKSEEDSSVFLLNRLGQIIYNPNQVKQPPVNFREIIKQINNRKDNVSYFKTNNAYIFFQKAVHDKVVIVKVIPNSMIMNGAMKTLKYGIIISVFSIILSVFLSIVVAFRTTKPIIKLVHAMQEVEDNNLDVKIETQRKDEIGLLEKKFTSMIQRIKELIEKGYKNEIEKRNAQFMALQAQINPHFLYNTLQLIGGMAITHNAREIYSVISALSDMFRYITRKQADLVLIGQEMNHIKNYLFIQNLRFEGKVETDIYIEEGTEHYYIPMLSLQPIVENAFNHGFEQKMALWKLSIEVQKVFDDIEITITDNGVGIQEERLQEIREQLQYNVNHPLDSKGSIGIKNVDARIKLYFGNDYGLDISSEFGNGTQVIIRIPATKTLEG